MYSQIALKLYALKKVKVIKSNAQFWREFNNVDKITAIDVDIQKYALELDDNGFSVVCAFDEKFPTLSANLKPSDKPFLFAYKERERRIVKRLVQKEFCIISGLANGCDTVAHTECLLNGGKTVAILPTNLESVYPKENAALAEKIVQGGGLVITEYVAEPLNRFENVNRFIERDRLQAMFSSRIVLVASFAQGQGDSGSRHALTKAREYGKERFVMYDEHTDRDEPIFGLNEGLIEDGVKVITPKILDDF